MPKALRQRAIVPEALANSRIDKALAALIPDMSRHLARKVLAMGGVHVGKRRVRMAGFTVRAGDELTAVWHPDVLEPERFALEVVYEDPDLVVVDKPSGQLSQGSELGDTGSLIHALTRRYGPQIRLMHRLDKGASGLLVAARNPGASAWLTPQFREHTLERTYLALVAGRPAEGWVEVPIVIEGRRARAAHPGEDGLPARSFIRVPAPGLPLDELLAPSPAPPPAGPGGAVSAASAPTLSAPGGPGSTRPTLVAVTLATGRTHQIRIHLAALGTPILGDPEYGGPPASRLMLHAAVLGLRHPDRRILRFVRKPADALALAIADLA